MSKIYIRNITNIQFSFLDYSKYANSILYSSKWFIVSVYNRNEAMRLMRDREDKTVLTQRDADRRIGERLHDVTFWRSELQVSLQLQKNSIVFMFAQSTRFVKQRHIIHGTREFNLLRSFAVRVGEEHERNSPSDGDEEESGEGAE